MRVTISWFLVWLVCYFTVFNSRLILHKSDENVVFDTGKITVGNDLVERIYLSDTFRLQVYNLVDSQIVSLRVNNCVFDSMKLFTGELEEGKVFLVDSFGRFTNDNFLIIKNYILFSAVESRFHNCFVSLYKKHENRYIFDESSFRCCAPGFPYFVYVNVKNSDILLLGHEQSDDTDSDFQNPYVIIQKIKLGKETRNFDYKIYLRDIPLKSPTYGEPGFEKKFFIYYKFIYDKILAKIENK